MKIDGACARLKEIVEGPTQGGIIEVLRTKNAGFLLPRLGEVQDRRGRLETRVRRMAPKEVLDRLAVKELRVHVQRPGNKAQGIDDHRFDGIAEGGRASCSRNLPTYGRDTGDSIFGQEGISVQRWGK